MTVTVYRSDDVGAPVLNGAAGALINVLDACLVTGYGAKAAAGWGKPFTGSGMACYRAPSGNRHYLFVNDSAGNQYAIVRGYRDMVIAGDAGTGPFPTTAQLAGGIRPIKSATADSVARPWIVVAGALAFYLWMPFNATDINAPTTSTDMMFFGEIVSYMPGDTMHTMLIGKVAANTTATATNVGNTLSTGADSLGHYLASSYLLDGNGLPCGVLQSAQAASASAGSAGPSYPDPITNGLLLEPMRVCEGGTVARLIRGHLPGVFNPIHPLPGNHLDVLQGRGALAGKELLLLYKGGTAGRLAFSLDEADWLTQT